MKRSLSDWCCLLAPTLDGVFPHTATSNDALQLLSEKYGMQRFMLMPTFDASHETIADFFEARRNTLQALARTELPPTVRVKVYGRALLVPGLSTVRRLDRLKLPKTDLLPLILPLSPYKDWMDEELNLLLYKAKLDLLLTSFELYPILYPPKVIERLLRMERACFQFNYRALEHPELCKMIAHLLMHGRIVLLGTGLNSMEKACYYDLEHFLSCGKTNLSSVLMDRLLEINRHFPTEAE